MRTLCAATSQNTSWHLCAGNEINHAGIAFDWCLSCIASEEAKPMLELGLRRG